MGGVIESSNMIALNVDIGRTEYRVQTLSGLACLSHTVSDIEKALARNSSTVLVIQYFSVI